LREASRTIGYNSNLSLLLWS